VVAGSSWPTPTACPPAVIPPRLWQVVARRKQWRWIVIQAISSSTDATSPAGSGGLGGVCRSGFVTFSSVLLQEQPVVILLLEGALVS
jgi:hypothetical protein